MNLDHLKYFVVTAETLHTGKASRILNISQSAISHSIAKLESELGQNLFEKVGKNIQLTVAGRNFALKAKVITQQLNQLVRDFQHNDIPLGGILKVGATHGISRFVLAPLLAGIQRQHSQLIFEVYSLRSSQVLEQIVNKTLDLGFCFSPNPHPMVQVLAKKQMELEITVRKKHPVLKMKAGERAGALSKIFCAAPKAFTGIEVCEDHPSLKNAGIVSNPSLIFDSYEVAAEYLKSTDFWALMPEVLLEPLSLAAVRVPKFKALAHLSIIAAKGVFIPEAVLKGLGAA